MRLSGFPGDLGPVMDRKGLDFSINCLFVRAGKATCNTAAFPASSIMAF